MKNIFIRLVIGIFMVILTSSLNANEKKIVSFVFSEQFKQIYSQFEVWSSDKIVNKDAQVMYLKSLALTLKSLELMAGDVKSARAFLDDSEDSTAAQIQRRLDIIKRQIRIILNEIENPFGDPINVYMPENIKRKEIVIKYLKSLIRAE